jgi:hypothetical protein
MYVAYLQLSQPFWFSFFEKSQHEQQEMSHTVHTTSITFFFFLGP